MCTGMPFKCISHIGLQPKKACKHFFQRWIASLELGELGAILVFYLQQYSELDNLRTFLLLRPRNTEQKIGHNMDNRMIKNLSEILRVRMKGNWKLSSKYVRKLRLRVEGFKGEGAWSLNLGSWFNNSWLLVLEVRTIKSVQGSN